MPKKVRLNLVLITAFTVQILAIVSIVSFLSFHNRQESIKQIIAQLRYEVSSQIKQQLSTYVDEPFRVNSLNAKIFAAGQIDPLIPFNGVQTFWNQSKLFPGLSMVYCGTETDGSMQGVGWLQPGKPLVHAMTNQSTDRFIQYFNLTVDGKPTTRNDQSTKRYDARRRPWYQSAIAKKSAVWSDIYLDFHTSLPTLSASQPVYDRGGKLLGVCGSDLFLPAEFSKFLQSRKIAETGIAFLVDRKNTLVSSSTQEAIITGTGEKTKRLLATESSNSRIQQIGRLLSQRAMTIKDSLDLEVEINGKKEYLSIFPYNDDRGIDWLVVVSLPEEDFTVQINRNTHQAILLCGVALVISILVSIKTSEWIARPILKLAMASERMARGELQQRVDPQNVWELDRLGRAFNSMSKELQELFHNLENKVSERTQALSQASQQIADLNLRLQEENLRMGAELEITYRLQQAILPKDIELQAISDLKIAGIMAPATEVGGDYYDVIYHNDTVTICMADVTGHGLESGILAIMTQVAARTLVIADEQNMDRFLTILNRVIFGNVQRMETEKNLSFLLLHYHQGKLLIAGQHEQVIYLDSSGCLRLIDTDCLGFPIGLVDDIQDFVGYEMIEMHHGDLVVTYTDGITEAQNSQNKLYGLERLCNILLTLRHQPVDVILNGILHDVKDFIDGHTIYDDISLVVFRVEGAGATPG
jgi:phosphoserine phosphatase RsbU/P